jgi:hypothetical protein
MKNVQNCRELVKYGQQGKAVSNEHNPHTTQKQEPAARSPGGPQTKTGQRARETTDIIIFHT